MVRTYSVPEWLGRILYRLARWTGARRMVEVGSGFGISTLYLAAAGAVEGMELDPWRASIAAEGLAQAGLAGHIIVGAAEDVIPTLRDSPPVGLAFIDAIHEYDATTRYFTLLQPRCSTLVFDDIGWTDGMRRAWRDIVGSPVVTDAVSVRGRLGCVVIRLLGRSA